MIRGEALEEIKDILIEKKQAMEVSKRIFNND